MGAGLPETDLAASSVTDSDETRLRSVKRGHIGPVITEFAPERVLLNCSRPEAVSEGLPILATLHPHVGAYANGFTRIADDFNRIGVTTDMLGKRQDLGPAAYAAFARTGSRPGPGRSQGVVRWAGPYRRAGRGIRILAKHLRVPWSDNRLRPLPPPGMP